MKKTLSALLVAGAIAFPAPAVAQAPVQDPALAQRVNENETVAPLGTSAVIGRGHADLGPLLIDDHVDFLVRDDSSETPTWRHLEDVVFDVKDGAKMDLPAGNQFDFTGAKAGDQVWVVPQTEIPGIVWLGWNTQAPAITRIADRGVTLDYLGHQGPGQYSLFLQAGGFAQPQQLYNSSAATPQSMWVDLNTHTHANWVFTEPGVHQVAMRVNVKKLDGTTEQATKVLKFAVGVPATDAAQATWQGELPTGATEEAAPEKTSANSHTALWVGLGLLVGAVLLGGGAWWLQTSARRARARATEDKQ